jgi:hypothetical protein
MPGHIFCGIDVGPTLAFRDMAWPDRKTVCNHCPALTLEMKWKREYEENSAPLCYILLFYSSNKFVAKLLLPY